MDIPRRRSASGAISVKIRSQDWRRWANLQDESSNERFNCPILRGKEMSSQHVGSLDRSSCFAYLLFFILVTNILVNFKYSAALPFKAQLGIKLSYSQSLPHLPKTNQISDRFGVVEFDILPGRSRVESRFGGISPTGQSSPGNVSPMAILAASMKPGTWAKLQTNNFKDGNELRPRLGGSALEYTDKAGAWNPVTKSVILLGSSHSSRDSPCPNSRDVFAIYTSSTNTWANNYDSNLPDPCPDFDDAFAKNGGIGHAYQHNTIDPNTGFFYHREFGTGRVMVYKQSTNAWSLCTVINPGSKNFQVAGGLAYFPDRNSLVFVDGGWGVWELSLASGDCHGTSVERASTFGNGKPP